VRSWQDFVLVAGDGFGGLLAGIGGAIPIGMAVGVGWSNRDRLTSVREVRGNGLRDVSQRANLDDRWLRLLQHQFFVDGADLGSFFPRLLAPHAVLFGSSHRNVVLDVANPSGVIRVNLQGVLIGA